MNCSSVSESRMRRSLLALSTLLLTVTALRGQSPEALYIFPAGGQRGKTVDVHVGGLFLHQRCGFAMLGPGIRTPGELRRTSTLWLEGPLVPLPESQQAEDYPKDMAARIDLASDAPVGLRHWQVWTAQGVTPLKKFVVGDLPEVVEDEIEKGPSPVAVTLPVTVNGRIFPREDVDTWSFEARRGQCVICEVNAARLGSALDSRLEVTDAQGRRIAENDDA